MRRANILYNLSTWLLELEVLHWLIGVLTQVVGTSTSTSASFCCFYAVRGYRDLEWSLTVRIVQIKNGSKKRWTMKQMCEPHDCILLDLAAWQVKKIQETLLFRDGVPLSEVSKYIAYIGLWIVKKKRLLWKQSLAKCCLNSIFPFLF